MSEYKGDLQDGMLAYYLSVAAQQDSNVEARIEREAFFLTPLLVNRPIEQEPAKELVVHDKMDTKGNE